MSFNIQDSHDFYVTLLSNKVGSYERGFHNTLSNFTNIFEKPLYLKGDWCVGLKSLICHNQFKNDAGNYLRVDCSIIKTEAEEHNSIALISRCPNSEVDQPCAWGACCSRTQQSSHHQGTTRSS